MIFSAPIARSSPSKNRCSRVTSGGQELSQLAVLHRPPSRAGRQPRAMVRGYLGGTKGFPGCPSVPARHRARPASLEPWCAANLPADHGDVDAACRELVQKLGRDGWLAHTAPDPDSPAALDVRTLCIIRETLARHDGLADFAFAMQGLGARPLS